MKDPRNPSKWSNREIEADSEGYVAAQQAYRDDQEAAEQQRQEADDERRFTEQFVRNGGQRSGAESAFRAHRDRQAAEAAARTAEEADIEALSATRRRVHSNL